jgi:2,3-bisphosphoglycerate-independent phosphoglycerate mutase
LKTLVLLGDGMADFPLAELGGKTPLEAANTPAMDQLAKEGLVGLFCPIPEGFPPGSDIGNLSLFGYNPAETFTGRAPLEAARQGIELNSNQVCFRCNLVTLGDGVMKSFTSGHISTAEADQIIRTLNDSCSDAPVVFYTGVSYRHLCVADATEVPLGELASIRCEPPHNITDKPFEPYLPQGEGSEFVRGLMERAIPLLRNHPVNAARIADGKSPATNIWLWGQGRSPKLVGYQETYGITGAVISAVDLVKGIGICAGLKSIDVPGATGYLDTNYAGKVRAGLDALEEHDFVYIHIEATDETSHEGRTDLKIQAIEDFDSKVVAPCMARARERGDVRIVVAPDHVTAISTKTHASGPVPFVVHGPGVEHNGASAYDERSAEATGVLLNEGYKLVPLTIRQSKITGSTFN